MSLQPKEEIGEEIHSDNDQFFRIESGHGKCIIDGNEYEIKNGDAIMIPAGAKHNIINIESNCSIEDVYYLFSCAS